MTPLYQTLAKTKAVLLERGWGKDWVEKDAFPVESPEAGRVCLATAIALAAGYKGSVGPLQMFLAPLFSTQPALCAIADKIDKNHNNPILITVTEWNDASERTRAEVLALVQEVADAHAL